MFGKIKGIYQYNQEDCGAACLATILNFHNKVTTISALRHEMSYDKNGANVLSIIEVAKKYGLEAEAYEGDFKQLQEQIEQGQFKYPMIVHVVREDIGGHFQVITNVKKGQVKVFDPKDGYLKLSVEDFIMQWTGIVICFEKSNILDNSPTAKKPFGSNYRYLKILNKVKVFLIFAIFLSIFISLISFLGAWIYKIVIDNHILKQPASDSTLANINFTALIISLLIFYFFQAFLSIVKNIFNAKAAKSLSNRFSESFLQHLIRIPPKNISHFETGEVLSRFQSITQIQQSYLAVIFTLTTEVLGAIIGGTILLIISYQLFIYVVIMVAVYSIIFFVFLPLLKKNRKKFYHYYSDSITALNQTIVGNTTILMQKRSLWFFDKIFSKVRKSNIKLYNIELLEGSASSLVRLTESVGSLAILWKGSLLVIQGTLSLGSLVAFQTMMMSFIAPIQQLVLIQSEIQNLRILTQRLDDLYDSKSERADLPISKEEKIKNYNIKVENISFSYVFYQNIIENINFEVKEGSKLGVIGNSGSGKTTLLKLIASLYSPTAGRIYLGDKPYDNYSLSKIREDIAYVDQTPFVFEGTILDNLIMGTPLSEKYIEHINEIAEICDLYHLNSVNSNDLNMLLDENGNNLSGGQKQKIGIARALIKKPKILLLDEATSNIDERSRDRILTYIYSLEGMTVISISHDKKTLHQCDHYLIVEKDRVEMIEAESINNDINLVANKHIFP